MIGSGAGLLFMACLWASWVYWRRDNPAYDKARTAVAWGAVLMFVAGATAVLAGLAVWVVHAVAS